MKATSPVGVPEPVTVPLNVIGVPCAKVVCERFSVVAEALKVTLLHWLERLATFGEPRPVAMSYPVTAVKPILAGVVVQVEVPQIWLLPVVISWNAHCELLAGGVDELQVAGLLAYWLFASV